MRRRLVVGAVAIAISAIALTLVVREPEETAPGPQSEFKAAKISEDRGTEAARTSVEGARPGDETVALPTPIRSRKVRISSPERRPGEKEEHYKIRLRWIDRFEKYEKRAQLTPEQREQLLQVMADTQQEAILSIQVLDDAIRRPNANIPDLGEIDDSLSWDLAEKVKPFLSKEQRLSLQRKSALSTGLGYGFYKPLDIEEL